MLSEKQVEEAYIKVRELALRAHFKNNGAVEALIKDHEAAVRGLRVLSIEKYQAGYQNGYATPDEIWIQETIEAATRNDVIAKLRLAEGAAFNLETELVAQERVAHDHGFGPDYAEEFHKALHGDDSLPTK